MNSLVRCPGTVSVHTWEKRETLYLQRNGEVAQISQISQPIPLQPGSPLFPPGTTFQRPLECSRWSDISLSHVIKMEKGCYSMPVAQQKHQGQNISVSVKQAQLSIGCTSTITPYKTISGWCLESHGTPPTDLHPHY